MYCDYFNVRHPLSLLTSINPKPKTIKHFKSLQNSILHFFIEKI